MSYPRTTLVAVLIAATTTVWLPTAMARGSQFEIELNIAPPPAVYEVVPAPRPGYIWAPGYWDYERNRHTWRRGHWEHERHGQRWAGGEWMEHDGRWHLNRGHWERG
jgi:hypothetical protein